MLLWTRLWFATRSGMQAHAYLRAPVDMAAKDNPVDTRSPEQKIVSAIKGLTDRNPRGTERFHALAQSRRLVMASDPAEIGYEDHGQGGEFNPENGKMYIYLDRAKPGEMNRHLLAATAHHDTHAGPLNDRAGRDQLVQQILMSAASRK